MSDLKDIARRHGLPEHLADELVGDSPEALEADAAARAALMSLFGSPRSADEPAINAEPVPTEPTQPEADETAEQDAFLKALFGTDQVATEPPIEGLPPGDKPIKDYTDAERAATVESFERSMRRQLEAKERERQEAEEQIQAEANLTDDQRLGDAIRADALPGSKAARNEAFVRSIHPGDEDRPPRPLPPHLPPGNYPQVAPPNPRLPDTLKTEGFGS